MGFVVLLGEASTVEIVPNKEKMETNDKARVPRNNTANTLSFVGKGSPFHVFLGLFVLSFMNRHS
jgi:hypothetical protein